MYHNFYTFLCKYMYFFPQCISFPRRSFIIILSCHVHLSFSLFFLPRFHSLPLPSYSLSRPPARSWLAQAHHTIPPPWTGPRLRSSNVLCPSNSFSISSFSFASRPFVGVAWSGGNYPPSRIGYTLCRLPTSAGGWRHAFPSSCRHRQGTYDRAGVNYAHLTKTTFLMYIFDSFE